MDDGLLSPKLGPLLINEGYGLGACEVIRLIRVGCKNFLKLIQIGNLRSPMRGPPMVFPFFGRRGPLMVDINFSHSLITCHLVDVLIRYSFGFYLLLDLIIKTYFIP